MYKQALKVPRSTSNMLVFMEMGRYPMQIQWLQRTLSYWNKLVANKANSELLDFVLAAEVHQGLFMDRDCWTKELLEALMFILFFISLRTSRSASAMGADVCRPYPGLAHPHDAVEA